MKKNNKIILLAVTALVLLAVFYFGAKGLKQRNTASAPTPNAGLLNKEDKSNAQLNKDFDETQKSVNDATSEVNSANQDNSSQDQIPSDL
jgi:hypothetical protein